MNDKISVVINTYNASRHLRRVLDSVRGFDEVVVCDMESTDDTVQIAREYGARVVTFPKGDHRICEPARDFAIHSAIHPWVLVVDADEIVPPGLREYLYREIRGEIGAEALDVPRINHFLGRPIAGSPDYQLRFFLRDRTHWPPVIHSRPQVDGRIRRIPAEPDLSLFHLANAGVADRIEKMNVYSEYEIPKYIGRRYGVGKMLLRPLWFFIKNFILGGGFRDGRRGLIIAYMSAMYQMTLLSKIVEKQFQEKGDKEKGKEHQP